MTTRNRSVPGVTSIRTVPAARSTESLDEFQDRLHRVLQTFLNGDFVVPGSRRLDLVRPLRLHACHVPWDVFQAAIGALHGLAGPGHGLNSESEGLIGLGQRRGWLVFGEAARLLSELYAVLDRLFEHTEPGPIEEIQALRLFDPKVYRERRLIAVERLAEYVQRALAPYVEGFYLHGSLSTLDYTSYSDVDDFVIVKRETVLEPAALERCAVESVAASRFLYEHDMLHHHRHYIVTEIDLRRYAPVYLPPEVLRFATVVVGRSNLRIATRDSIAAHRGMLRSYAEGLLKWGSHGAAAENAWHLKSLVSSVLMLPVLYLETQGTYCYKKFSFDLARSVFGTAWTAVELASEIRRAWTYRPTPRERLLQRVVLGWLGNPVLFGHIMSGWAQRVPREVDCLVRNGDLYRKTSELAHKALQLLGSRQEEQ